MTGRRSRPTQAGVRRGPARRAAPDGAAGAGDLAAAMREVEPLLRAAGLPAGPGSLAAFRAYLETLRVWSRAVSLTAARTLAGVVREHVADALPVARLVPPGASLADLGSGAGLPGVPVAIARPDVRVTLIEARRKRANFLRDVVRRADLANVEVVEARVEPGRPAPCGPVDVVVGRAVGTLDRFLDCAGTLLVAGGLAVAMKGPRGQAEAAAAAARGYEGPEAIAYRLPGGARRFLLVYRRR